MGVGVRFSLVRDSVSVSLTDCQGTSGGRKKSSLVLLASTHCDLQQAPEWFATGYDQPEHQQQIRGYDALQKMLLGHQEQPLE